MKEIDFEKDFSIYMTALKIARLHPKTKYTKCVILQILLVFAFYTASCLLVFNSTLIYLKTKDYFNALRNFVPLAYYSAMVVNYCMIIANKKTICELIDYIKADYNKMNDMDDRDRAVKYEHSKKGSLITYRWLMITTSAPLIFALKSIILSLMYYLRGEYKYVQFHELIYPSIINDLRGNNLFVHIATYCNEMGFTILTAGLYFCVVPLGLISILHACGQLELVKLKFENVFVNDNAEERLIQIVKDMQCIYGYVKNINKCYKFMYEIQLKLNMLLISLSSYAIIKSLTQGTFTVEYVIVLLGEIFVSSLPCYYGDLLMGKGEEVRQAAYMCGWERVHNLRARKILLIILTRALRPVAINSIFRIINLDTLTNVYRQSYTIFNLIMATER